MKISQMTTLDQLTKASEYTKYSLQDLVTRAAEITTTEKEYNDFVTLCRGYERTIKAGSWNRVPPTVKAK